MTNAPTSAPAGWYLAPDGSSASWWWDGVRWMQPHQQPAHRPPTSTLAKLATATQVLLIVCGVMSIVAIAHETFGISAVGIFFDGNDSSIDIFNVYDQSALAIGIFAALSGVAAGVLWAVWQYRVAKRVDSRLRRSTGWHAASWFVPVICLWFPYQNILDLWRAVGRVRPPWQIVWWLLWLVSNVVAQLSMRIYTAAEDLEQLRVAMWMSLAGEVLLLAAVPLAWMIVRGITRGILQHSAAPAPSPMG